MAPGLLEHPFYNDQTCHPVKMGSGKRKSERCFDHMATNFLDNPLLNAAAADDHDQTNGEVVNGLGQDLSISPFYPRRYLTILDNATSTWQPPRLFSEQPLGHKRIKRSMSMVESMVSSSNMFDNGAVMNRSISTNSLPKLQFRDHIWTYTQRYLAAEAIEDAIVGSEEKPSPEEGNGDGMRLVQLLISCAEAMACHDKAHASALLSELHADALIFGSSFQRVASCFVQGLTDRLALIQPLGEVGVVRPTINIMDIASENKEEALRLVYQICPHIQFGHFVANLTILEAFEGESFVHIVDLGMTLGLPHGHQWRALIESLAKRTGHPLHRLRITGVGPCVGRFQIIGNELKAYAQKFGINLEFSAVETSLENFKPKDIKTYDNEVLVVNSILHLHCVVKESRGALNSVLQIIHELSPKVLVLVEQDSSHNSPFFLGRFMEALHYYLAIFNALDAILLKYDTKRAKIKQFYFAEEIKNIVSCEGPGRVERHERVDQWRRRMSRAGFQAAPIKMVAQAKQWLEKLNICEGYTIVEEKGCLVLGARVEVEAHCRGFLLEMLKYRNLNAAFGSVKFTF